MLPVVALVTSLGVLPQTGAVSRLTATAEAAPRFYAGTQGGGVGALARVSLTWHPLAPIVDDDAPLDLQPFLQRVSGLGVVVGGTYDRVRDVTPVTASNASVALVADFTLFRALVLGAQVGWDTRRLVSDMPAMTTDTLSTVDHRVPLVVGLTAGFRVNDLRVDVTWDPLHKRLGDYPEEEHHVTVRARAVVDRSVDLGAEFHRYGGGGAVSAGYGGAASAAWYPSRRVGLRAEASVANVSTWSGAILTDLTVGGGVRASWWATPRVGLDAGYLVAVESGQETYVRHAVRLGATFRLGW